MQRKHNVGSVITYTLSARSATAAKHLTATMVRLVCFYFSDQPQNLHIVRPDLFFIIWMKFEAMRSLVRFVFLLCPSDVAVPPNHTEKGRGCGHRNPAAHDEVDC